MTSLADREKKLRALDRAARRALRRVRFGDALNRLCRALPWLLLYMVGALTYVKAARPGPGIERWLVVGALVGFAVVVASTLVRYFARRPPLLGAARLDSHHGLADRVSNALAFSRLPAEAQSPMMKLAILDALEKAEKLDPRRAVPIRVPGELGVSAFLAAALVGIAQLEVRTTRELPPPPAALAPLLTDDDLELFRERLEELSKTAQDAEQVRAVERYNALLEDIAARRVDREEVFRRMAELEKDVARDLEADREALDEGLKSLAQEFEKSSLARKAANALDARRLDDAEKALHELAEKLGRKNQKPSKAELEKLRSALEKASQASTERLQAIERQRQELQRERESLLKKKQQNPDGGLPPADQQKLAENQRKLERLDREKDRAERAKRQLDELDKKLAEAAQKLMEEMGESAKALEQGAETLNRMAQKDLTREQKQELLRRLEELREVLRQQGKGGKDQQERLRKFSQRARGQAGQGDGQQQGQGQPGQGQKGQGELRIGRGQGQGIELPVPRQGQPQAGQGQGQGDLQGSAGPGRGTGSGGEIAGEATNLKGEAHDVTAAAVDTGQGTASAEVIYGAAARGFGSKAYKDIFVEYQTVAEQNIDKDDIPPGYRFYVRRYFQLIRPRE